MARQTNGHADRSTAQDISTDCRYCFGCWRTVPNLLPETSCPMAAIWAKTRSFWRFLHPHPRTNLVIIYRKKFSLELGIVLSPQNVFSLNLLNEVRTPFKARRSIKSRSTSRSKTDCGFQGRLKRRTFIVLLTLQLPNQDPKETGSKQTK